MRKSPKPNSPEPRKDLSRKALGDYGEGLVARWYETRGYQVLNRQWRCPGGELDLVVSRGDLVVFCEVKTRKSLDFGGAEVVGWAKQGRLRRAAAAYLSSRDGFVPEVRFDVAVVCNSRVDVIEEAF